MPNEECVDVLRSIRKHVHKISNSIMVISGRAQISEHQYEKENIEKLIEEIERQTEKISDATKAIYDITDKYLEDNEE